MSTTSQHNEQADAIPDLNAEESDRLGENPARFLVEDITMDAGDGTTGELIFARIRGIQTLDLIDYWEGVERWLAKQNDREPREAVFDALEERKAELEVEGEGYAQVDATPEELGERAIDQESESVAVLVDEDSEEIP